MIQGVRDVFELVDVDVDAGAVKSELESEEGSRGGKIVLIGRGLASLPVEISLLFVIKGGGN